VTAAKAERPFSKPGISLYGPDCESPRDNVNVLLKRFSLVFIHSGYFYSASSNPLLGLLRGDSDTARVGPTVSE